MPSEAQGKGHSKLQLFQLCVALYEFFCATAGKTYGDAAIFVVALVFVYRSFYSMRIPAD